jgi:hypothetical protein
MRMVNLCSVIACLAAGISYGDESDEQLLLAIDAATVDIEPRPAESRIINLPGIEFSMHIRPRCDDDMQTESVSISIADTRVNFGPEVLLDQDTVDASIRIPGKQIAPLAIENFCIAGDNENATTHLRVHDVLSAQVSLKCIADDRQLISYQTTALDVLLSCKSPDVD